MNYLKDNGKLKATKYEHLGYFEQGLLLRISELEVQKVSIQQYLERPIELAALASTDFVVDKPLDKV